MGFSAKVDKNSEADGPKTDGGDDPPIVPAGRQPAGSSAADDNSGRRACLYPTFAQGGFFSVFWQAQSRNGLDGLPAFRKRPVRPPGGAPVPSMSARPP